MLVCCGAVEELGVSVFFRRWMWLCCVAMGGAVIMLYFHGNDCGYTVLLREKMGYDATVRGGSEML